MILKRNKSFTWARDVCLRQSTWLAYVRPWSQSPTLVKKRRRKWKKGRRKEGRRMERKKQWQVLTSIFPLFLLDFIVDALGILLIENVLNLQWFWEHHSYKAGQGVWQEVRLMLPVTACWTLTHPLGGPWPCPPWCPSTGLSRSLIIPALLFLCISSGPFQTMLHSRFCLCSTLLSVFI